MEFYQARAAILKAIAHPVRLRIADILRQEPECVCHLSAALTKPQPYISQQLAILRNAGVILDEREGTNVYYRLAGAGVASQVAAACDALADGPAGRRLVHGCVCPKCMEPGGLKPQQPLRSLPAQADGATLRLPQVSAGRLRAGCCDLESPDGGESDGLA